MISGRSGRGPTKDMCAREDVEELRDFVDAILAQETADGRDAGIVLGGPDGAGLLGIDAHGAEFRDLERRGQSARCGPGGRRQGRGR